MKRRTQIPQAFILVVSVMVLAAAVEGCSRKTSSSASITIGVSYQDLQNEFVIRLQNAIRAEAKTFNVNLVELDAQGRAERQISHIENFVARGVDAIILNPEDQHGSAPAVDIAVRERKPIVVVNAIVANLNKASAYVGSPDVDAGRMECLEIMRLLHGQGNIVVLQGPYGHSAELQRTQGLKEVLAKYPKAQIIAEQTGNWDRAQAMSVMENWLSAGRRIDAVLAENDEMALGALAAIAGAGKKRSILVIGIDAIPDALEAVEEGKMAATVYQDAVGQGKAAVDLARDLVKGKSVQHTYFIPFQLVTKENVKNFIEGKESQ